MRYKLPKGKALHSKVAWFVCDALQKLRANSVSEDSIPLITHIIASESNLFLLSDAEPVIYDGYPVFSQAQSREDELGLQEYLRKYIGMRIYA